MATHDDRAQNHKDELPPYPQVGPATDEEVARLEEARRFWQTPRGRRWLETGEPPVDDEDEDAVEDDDAAE